ncbi:MAG TPA: DUF302 domain-containing protein [Cyclobacteriaceae bacterium]|nr:DUF302 domain-containing protein [Cyclobacteriaceae bacterium]
MKKNVISIILILSVVFAGYGQSANDNGLITLLSAYPVKETADRFVETVTTKGLTVFARIDHAANALKQGIELRPTELVVFGNPKAGTPLMQDNQVAGIDLPLKILVWEDENGKVWLTYNDPNWIVERHGLSDKSLTAIKAMQEGLRGMTEVVVKK